MHIPSAFALLRALVSMLRRLTSLLIAGTAQSLLVCSPLLAAPIALQLNENNIDELQSAGPDAIGGLGDWLLSNGTVCAVISDIKHESGLTASGGVLVDVYHCDKDNDQWTYQHFFPNVDKDMALSPQRVVPSQNAAIASVEVLSAGYGLELSSTYSVNLEQPTQIQAAHKLRRMSDGPRVTMLGALVLHPYTSLTPFSISTKLPDYSLGLNYPASSRMDMSSLIASMVPADTHVLVGDYALGQVSYGIQLHTAELQVSETKTKALSVFQQTASTYSMQGALSRPPWLGGNGKLGMFEFAQSQLMDIAEDESVQLQQTIYLGSRADVASISDQIYQGAKLNGSVGSSTASVVEVYDQVGNPVTVIRPDENGDFSAVMPRSLEKLELVVKTIGLDAERKYSVSLEAGQFSAGALSVEPPARLRIENQLPVRLTFVGQGDTRSPEFYANGISARFGDADRANIQTVNYLNFAGVASDPVEVTLAAGRYRVLASRGMAYGVTETEIELKVGTNETLVVKPPMQEIQTTGLLASDFHVHSAPSFDSYIAIEERVRGFVAQGGEVLVATEHNVLVDYSRVLDDMGLRGKLNIMTGMELTGIARTPEAPYTNGHLNVFPQQVSSKEFAGGLPAHEGKRLRELYSQLRSNSADVLIQLNHPRTVELGDEDSDGNYFEHLVTGERYDRDKPLSNPINASLIEKDSLTGLRDVDFDVLEVANGPHYDNYIRTRDDWFSLLNQGEKIVATANSDSHGNNQLVAIPQSFVSLGSYSESGLLKAVKNGQLFGTTGPVLKVQVQNENGSVEPGGTARGKDLTLSVSVDSASWVPVSELSVFVNGKLFEQKAIARGESLALPLRLLEDAYVVVQVTGDAGEEESYKLLAPGFVPLAFSNPIYIDANQDGQWNAPGLSQ